MGFVTYGLGADISLPQFEARSVAESSEGPKAIARAEIRADLGKKVKGNLRNHGGNTLEDVLCFKALKF